MKNVAGMLLVTAVLLIHYVQVPADTTHVTWGRVSRATLHIGKHSYDKANQFDRG